MRRRAPRLVTAFRAALPEVEANAALTAAALMAMNNAWYPYVEMTGDAELKARPAQLRMQAYATHGGVDKRLFELFALAASIVGKCHFCVQSHYALLKESGMSVDQLRDVGRIAAVTAAAANAIAIERTGRDGLSSSAPTRCEARGAHTTTAAGIRSP